MYSSEEKAHIWIDLFDFVSLAKKNQILKYYENYKNIKNNFKNDGDKIKILVTEKDYRLMCQSIEEEWIEDAIYEYDKKGIKVISRCNKKWYPEKLFTLDPPVVLYVKGNIELLKSRYSIAVVGSRQPSRYGKNITEKFTRILAKNGFTIVSGLAYGVDSIAHSVCMEEKGETIAVLGSGFDNVYPSTHTDLFNKIIQNNGLVVSEYRPSVKPLGYHFPNRNRVIVAVTNGVLITEASEKSGTMYTKDYAIDSGTELMVVPGNIDSLSSSGCNKIIKEYPSTMVTKIEDIFTVYNFNGEQKIKEEKFHQFSMEEQIIISVIGAEVVHYDEIFSKTGLPSKDLNITLTTLQLKGFIRKLPGNLYELIK